jgi:hypothetical protein
MSEDMPAPFDRAAAAAALSEADRSHKRSSMLHAYRVNAPMIMGWGAIIMATDLALAYLRSPMVSAWAWPVASLTGTVISALYFWRVGKGSVRPTQTAGSRAYFWRMMATWGCVFGFIASVFVIFAPFDWRESHAFWGILLALMYTVGGVWSGGRLTILGLVLAAVTFFAYFRLEGRPFLVFMGVATGGSMVLGGLWLRRA